VQAALELRLALPYTALPGGAHLSKRHVSTGQCLLSLRRMVRAAAADELRELVAASRLHERERGRVVLREFIAVFFGVWPTNGEAA
jgi:hypothetical protein